MGRLGASLAIASSIALAACAGGDSTSPEQFLGIGVSPTTIAVPAGGTASVGVALTRGGGFAGA